MKAEEESALPAGSLLCWEAQLAWQGLRVPEVAELAWTAVQAYVPRCDKYVKAEQVTQ